MPNGHRDEYFKALRAHWLNGTFSPSNSCSCHPITHRQLARPSFSRISGNLVKQWDLANSTLGPRELSVSHIAVQGCYAQVFTGLDLQHAHLLFDDDIQASYKPFLGTYTC